MKLLAPRPEDSVRDEVISLGGVETGKRADVTD